MNDASKQLKTSSTVLILMLTVRMITPVTDFIYGSFISLGLTAPTLIDWFANKVVAPWVFPTFTNFSPVLLIIAIFFYRKNLQDLSVDELFLLMSIYSGLVITWSFFFPAGWISGIASIFLLAGIIKGYITVKQTIHNYYLPIIIVSVVCVVVIFFITLNNFDYGTYKNFSMLIVGYIFAGIVYEEFVFRGLLWAFLESKKWSISKIILFQAFIFSVAHINIVLLDPLYFFVGVPLFSLLLGWIVWRTKSLSLSTFVHVVINISIVLLG